MLSAILAQISYDQVPALVQWLIGGSVTVFLLNQILTFYKEHIRETPAPANTYATRADMDAELGRERGARKKMHEEMTEIQKSITALQIETKNQTADIDTISLAVGTMRSEIRTDVNGVQSRISDVLSAVSELKGQVKQALKEIQ